MRGSSPGGSGEREGIGAEIHWPGGDGFFKAGTLAGEECPAGFFEALKVTSGGDHEAVTGFAGTTERVLMLGCPPGFFHQFAESH